MPVLSDADVGLDEPKVLTDADVGLADAGPSLMADHPGVTGLSPEARKRKIYGDYLRSRQEDIAVGGSPSAGSFLEESAHEQGANAHALIRPLMRGAPALGPTKPGGVREGLEEAATSLLAAPFDPTVGIPMALTPIAPEVMAPYWALQGAKDLPEGIAQTVTGDTASEKVQGGLRTVMDALMLHGGLKSRPLRLTEDELAGLDRTQRAMPPQALDRTQRPLTMDEAVDNKARQGLNPAVNGAALDERGHTPRPAGMVGPDTLPTAPTPEQQPDFNAPGQLPADTRVKKPWVTVPFDPVEAEPKEPPTVPEHNVQSRLQRSRDAAKIRQLNKEIEAEAKPDAAGDITGRLPGDVGTVEVPRPGLPEMAEPHVELVSAILKVASDPKASLDQLYGAMEALPTAKRVVEGQIARLEDRGENADHLYDTLGAFEKFESSYHEVVTKPSETKGKARSRDILPPDESTRLQEAIKPNPTPPKEPPAPKTELKELPKPEPKPSPKVDEPSGISPTDKGVGKEEKQFRATAEGQKVMAGRASRIATLNQLNEAIRKVAPNEAYAKSLLDSLPDSQIDSMRDGLVADYNRLVTKPKVEPPIKTEAVEPARPATAVVKAPIAKVQAQVSKVAKTEGVRSAADVKEELIAEIQDKLQKVPSDLNDVPPEQRKVTIEIPGDGKFTVKNTVEAISEVLERAKKVKTDSGKAPGVPKKAIKLSADAIKSRAGMTKPESEPPKAPPPEPNPGPHALGFAPGQQVVKAIGEKLSSLREKLSNSWATRGNKADIARLKDAADNQAKVDANQKGRSVLQEARKTFGSEFRQALRAVVPVIESGGDRTKLAQFITQATGRHLEATKAAQFADTHWDRLQPLAAKIKAFHDAQIADENANGIATEYRDNYIKHAFDVDKLPNRGQEFFGGGGGAGTKSGFKAARKFDTIYDAIEAGYGKAIKSMDAAKLTESRLAAGQQLINDRQWVNTFRNVADPTTGKPLIESVTFDKNHFPIAPPGYDAVPVLPGQFVAVHNGYRAIFDAVTGGSKIAGAEVAGLPVGAVALNTAAGVKHGLLLFDTFHASRIMQKQFFLTGKASWNKGLSLLEYADADLNEAVRQGSITQEMADYARANRGTAKLLLREGLNVGRIQEALRNEVVRNLPVIGTFNKWVFDKVTRGAMMESALLEFDRVRANNPSMTAQDAAALTAKKINVTFGNIGRQGLFKSRTMQDLSRLLALAPQWVESMARSELGGFTDLGKVPVDVARGKGLQVGTLGKTMAGGLLAYVVGTQLLNLATRGQPTWQNKEEGHKLDAWIPDVTGKTPGFFLNPLSVVAELTHDAYRYAFKKESALDVGTQMAENRMSPFMRATKTLWSGKAYEGDKKAVGTWPRIAKAAISMAPTPIPLSGLNSDKPGQMQRQLTASAGIKTEVAETSHQQLNALTKEWMKRNPDPKVQHEWEKNQERENGQSDYKPLRDALQAGDMAKARAEYEKLLPIKHGESNITRTGKLVLPKSAQQQIAEVFRPYTGKLETGDLRQKSLTGLNQAEERKFMAGLTAEQKNVVERAKQERQAIWQRFNQMLRK